MLRRVERSEIKGSSSGSSPASTIQVHADNLDCEAQDSLATNAINKLAQRTSEIRHKSSKDLVTPDLMSRRFSKAYLLDPEDSLDYVPPETTMALLEEVAMNVTSPSNLAEAQKSCLNGKAHREGRQTKVVENARHQTLW